MGNYETVQAITTNLEAILTSIGLSLEDASSEPTGAAPLVKLKYPSDDAEYDHGEKPGRSTINIKLEIEFRESSPDLSRDKQQYWTHMVRDNVSVAVLNVGALSASKLVGRVDQRSRVEYSAPVSRVFHDIEVRYRQV